MKRILIGLLAVLLLSSCSVAATYFVRNTLYVDILAYMPKKLSETSGLAIIDGDIWTQNDTYGQNKIYRLNNDLTGIAQTVKINKSLNRDWEDLAQDQQYIYIADIGNNLARRKGGSIYKVDKSQLHHQNNVTPTAVLNFQYADFKKGWFNKHNFDSEAITIVGDQLWLFTKNWENENTKLYRLDTSTVDQMQYVKPVAEYPSKGLITGVDYDPQTSTLAFIGYRKNMYLGYSFIWLVKVKNNEPDWSTGIYKRLGIYSQWEAIHWYGEGRLLITAEKNPLNKAMIGIVDVQKLLETGE
ncbi:lipoprotein [Photobacterium sp. Alg240-V54]|uniref:lipoprotein n=1 Tax=Photobacterium sp. Alg240-V54 TaxID=2305995 RepID=UPI001F077997|nr:lipoprotein [Photobacterium sp. Alg240-V54]